MKTSAFIVALVSAASVVGVTSSHHKHKHHHHHHEHDPELTASTFLQEEQLIDGEERVRYLDADGEDNKKSGGDNCETITEKAPTPCPPVPPPKLPKQCAGVSASWSGDPHFKTFDKVKYDCQGEGEFTIVKSEDSDFHLQGRFVKFRSNKRPTVTKAIAFDTGDGEPTIQVNVPEGNSKDKNFCDPYVFIEGARENIADEGDSIGGIRIQKTKSNQGGGLIFYYEESEVQLQVWSKKSGNNGCVLAAEICIPDCYERRSEKFVGLLGTPDGDKSNDWTGHDGTVFPLNAKKHKKEYEYCVPNWCVRDSDDSLFTYEDGKDFDDYMQCDLPVYDMKNDCVVDVKKIEKICGEDQRECIVDGCVGGVKAAEAYVESTLNMVDRNCGKEIFFENFDGDVKGEDWGNPKLMKKKNSDMKGAEKATKYLNLNRDNNKVEREFTIPKDATLVLFEYLFYEIGDWEKEGTYMDVLKIKVNNIMVDIGGFDGATEEGFEDSKGGLKSGVTEGIAWSAHPITKQGNLGFGNYGNGKDQIYKISMNVPGEVFAETGKLDFAMSVKMTGKPENESAGIDDLRLTAFREGCKIDCNGVTVITEDFDLQEQDASDWGSTVTLPDGHTILGPLLDDTEPIAKTFEVAFFAGVATIEFLLYGMGHWTESPSNKFWVRVGGTQFDIGSFKEDETAETVTSGDVADGGIHWERTPMANGARLTGGEGGSIHLVTIDVDNELFSDGYLTLGFDVESDDEKVSAGIDEFRIRLFPEPEKCEKAKKDEVVAEDDNSKCPEKKDPEKPKKCYKEKTTEVCAPTSPPSPYTDEPTTSPTKAPTWITGDPHLKTWSGRVYDFHGGCDLVMLSNPKFNNGQGIHVHVRTKIQRWWSSIVSCAIRIGNDTFEVHAGIEDRKWWLNGKEGHKFLTSRNLDFTVGGFGGRYRMKNANVIQYKINLPDDQSIIIRSMKDMLRVELEGCDDHDFGHSLGLMGSFEGALVGRDGKTVFTDTDAFGLEWQVSDQDPLLFHAPEGPQFPEQCTMPDHGNMETQRRLSATIDRDAAEKACSSVASDDFKNCVFDVLAMDDVSAVEGY